MKVGVHLPLADFGDGPPTGADLRTYASTARDLGYTTLAANDHLSGASPGSTARLLSPRCSPQPAT